ncbi:cytokine receptor common subunit beta isoform X2 [Corythoichthys intestinalis]|uniref:cytokine receptor common subunit beta isoform X2 n=1 Tax=Corythoichthys intestinalis TaxID=161448 RepID=UPI0025A65786|nr:cytokine receptor common subunit beta isoform X2 [Corythoichthys intestinalis]
MMHLLWVLLWLMFPPLAFLSNPDECNIHDAYSSNDGLMKSLECHNDYESYVFCKWREGPHIRAPLQLWFHTESGRQRCEPFGDEIRHTNGHRTVQCRYATPSFSIGIQHTVFFVKEDKQCSSGQLKPLALSRHMRARTPVDLSQYDTGDGHLSIKWSSPYPVSSSLNTNLMYQLGYKAEKQDTWTIKNVTSTDIKLETHRLLPGQRYEARVRARASIGHWSHWSPVVTWRTKEVSGQSPSLDCVLDGEKKVMCSWEVSSELDHIITYQLACQHNHSAPSESCCTNPIDTFDPSRQLVQYRCLLSVASPARLQLLLQPTRKAKTFRANEHIRPRPPQQLNVSEKGNIWVVEWAEPSTASKIRVYYQVRYYRMEEKGSSILLNISEGSTSLNLLGSSLNPLQQYQVQVRSVVIPGEGSYYEGIPSEWTKPVDWTSHAAMWPINKIVYSSIGVMSVFGFVILYWTIPACKRKVILWVETVPSPGKSKILSEIKSSTSQTLMENDNTYICKVHQIHSLSTCISPSSSLRPTEGAENKDLEQDRQDCKCNSLPLPAEKSLDSKSMREETKVNEVTPSDAPSSTVFATSGRGYVCLPRGSVSASTSDLVSHWDTDSFTQKHEQNHQCADNAESSDKMPDSDDPPPAYSSETSWPTIRPSGYCFLPPQC